MEIGLPNLRNLVFDRESMDDLGSLGIDLSTLPTINPVSIEKMPTPAPAPAPATATGGTPGTNWWQTAGYPDAATAIMSGNFRYDMNTGWQLKPGAVTPAMELAEPVTTPEDADNLTKLPLGATDQIDPVQEAFVAPPEVIQSAIENLPVTIEAMTSPDLGPLGTSGMAVFEDEPITMTSDSTSPMSPMVGPGVPLMESDIDRIVETALKEAMASGDVPVQAAADPILTIDPVIETVDPVTKAVSQVEPYDFGEAGSFGTIPTIPTPPPPPPPEDNEPQVRVDKAQLEARLKANDPVIETVDPVIETVDPVIETVDPVQAAVDAAVGNGQPTTDDTILQDNRTERPTGKNNPNLEAFYNSPMYKNFKDEGGIGTTMTYTASDGTFFGSSTMGQMYEQFLKDQAASQPNTETPAQPDFMTQLQELIAQMQAEQKAAAEQAAAAEQQRQEQVAAMTQNYMVGQPAVGYNPYESGQYQNNPYGAAGVPAMGGITTIPVPAAYNPNPYLVGGMT